MTVIIEQTPNPNALKFTVGQDIGGPTTVVAGQQSEDVTAPAPVDLDGVTGDLFLVAMRVHKLAARHDSADG